MAFSPKPLVANTQNPHFQPALGQPPPLSAVKNQEQYAIASTGRFDSEIYATKRATKRPTIGDRRNAIGGDVTDLFSKAGPHALDTNL